DPGRDRAHASWASRPGERVMRFKRPHPDQLPFEWSKDAEIERIIEARVAIRAEAAALSWRLRLIVIEAC
ncbi:hypothetical protein, partial [Pseudomonas aeruginosa]